MHLPPLPDTHRARAGLPCGTMARLTVFTALDGTLLDAHTLDAGAARATIARLRNLGIPVVPVTAMTLGELAPIAADLGFDHAIIEGGAAIARRNRGGWDVEACGLPAETLLDVVREVEDRTGANLFVHSAGEIPFTIESGDLDAVRDAAADAGFSVRRGRRFLHLCRECDEGQAFTRLREELSCDVAIAVGSTLADAGFLSRANIAIIVPGANGEADSDLLAKVPHAHIAPAPAPRGWAAAVERVVRDRPEASGGRAAGPDPLVGSASATQYR